jgi:hypothetical protein
MSTTTIRISKETHRALRALARESGMSIASLVAQAVETWRRQGLLERSNAAYASLREDASALEAEEQERRVWEATLLDGMEGQ